MPGVTGHLLAGGDGQNLIAPALDFHHAPFWFLSRQRLAFQIALELAGGEQAEIRTASPRIAQLRHGPDLGVKAVARLIQQMFQRAVVRSFGDAAAGVVNLTEGGEAGFEGVHGAYLPCSHNRLWKG